jgi:N-methylhydantoinase A
VQRSPRSWSGRRLAPSCPHETARPARRRRVVVGVDIGGTFTDLVLTAGGGTAAVDEQGPHHERAIHPRRSSTGARVLVARHGLTLADVSLLEHGTTLATNAIIERKGAVTALLTTEGYPRACCDGTELRYDLYDCSSSFPEPLVPRERRMGIAERTDWNGKVRRPVETVKRCPGPYAPSSSAGVDSVGHLLPAQLRQRPDESRRAWRRGRPRRDCP